LFIINKLWGIYSSFYSPYLIGPGKTDWLHKATRTAGKQHKITKIKSLSIDLQRIIYNFVFVN